MMKSKPILKPIQLLGIPLSILLLFGNLTPLHAQCNPASDRAELVNFYNVTGGNGWITKTNWNSAQPISTWYGIRTNAQGCVTGIDLDGTPEFTLSPSNGNNLIGTLPNLNLPFLQILILSSSAQFGNRLTGSIPNFSSLPNLDYLSLFDNNFTGGLPALTAVPKLSFFSCSNNAINGTIPSYNLPLLTGLYIDGNQLTGGVPSMAVPMLTNFRLKNNLLDGAIAPYAANVMFECENNSFTFEDLLPNLPPIVPKTYAPQAPFGTTRTVNGTVGTALTIDLGIDASITSNVYTWFKGGVFYRTVNGSNKLVFASLVAGDAGNYTCQVTNPSLPSLTLNSRTITLQISACTVTAGTPIAAQQLCAGQNTTIALETLLLNETLGGSWTALQTTGANFNATAGTLIINGLAAGTYRFTYTVTGCATDSKTVSVVISPTPTANAIDTLKQCGVSPLIFNLSQNNPQILGTQTGIVNWFSTNGTTNPIANPANYSSSGGTVYAQVKNTEGCVSTLLPVVLLITNSVSAGTSTPLSVCSGLSTINLASRLSGANTGGTWTALQANTGNCFNAAAATFNPTCAAAGTYRFSYKIGNGCGNDSAIVQVNIGAIPKAEAGQALDTLTCAKTSIILRGSVLANNTPTVVVQWTTPAGNSNNADFTTNRTGWHYFTATDNLSQCSSKDSVLIGIDTVHPLITLIKTDSSRCGNSFDGKITLSTSNGRLPFIYRLSNGRTSNSNTFDLLRGGVYGVVVEGANGCQASSSAFIGSPPAITAKIAVANPVIYKGSLLSLSATVLNNRSNVRYTWTTSDASSSFSCTLCPTPQYKAVNNAAVKVTATDTYNCSASDTLLIKVRESFIPDVISPNNDGSNDVLIFPDLETCGSDADCDVKYPNNELIIANRWGSEVFRAKPYRNNWDGKNNNGERLPQGTYYYVMRLDLAQGRIIKANVLLMSN